MFRFSSLQNPLIRVLSYFFWVRVKHVPKWVYQAENGYYEGFIQKYKMRPYNKTKIFIGKNYKYKVFFHAVAQGNCVSVYHVKKK